MVIIIFVVKDKKNKFYFFKKTFLLFNLSMNVIFKMLFLALSNIKVNFLELKIFEKIYTLRKTILTMK